MELEATVLYKGASTCYKISSSNQHEFHACLLRYDGSLNCLPPSSITLIKGAHHWTGTAGNPELHQMIGNAIYRYCNGDLLFCNSGVRANPLDDIG